MSDLPTPEGVRALRDARPTKKGPKLATWVEVWIAALNAIADAYMDDRLVEPDTELREWTKP